VTRFLRLFAEGKFAAALDRDLAGGATTGEVDQFELQNGFSDVIIPVGEGVSVTLRGGRQELLFGAQRLVGPSEWSNVRRTFDGGRAIIGIGEWTINPLWTQLVVDKYTFNPDHVGAAAVRHLEHRPRTPPARGPRPLLARH
jgi:Alginate export